MIEIGQFISNLISYLNTRSEQKNQANQEAYIKFVKQVLQDSPAYHELCTAVMYCVACNYQSCGLLRPINSANHVAPLFQRVVWDSQYGVLFQYEFNRASTCPGGMRVMYSTIPVSNMVAVLNHTIPNFTVQAGYGATSIVRQGDLSSGRVYFRIVPFSDYATLNNYIYILKNS